MRFRSSVTILTVLVGIILYVRHPAGTGKTFQVTASRPATGAAQDAVGRDVQMTAPLAGVTTVEAGAAHTCAVASGGAKCWGFNGAGQLGDGTNTNRNTPVDVSGMTSGVAAIAGGGSHTCAVTTGGGVKCWGANGAGQLGDGTNVSRNTPVSVTGLTSGVAAIAAGTDHTCALTTGGAVKCWGANDSGQLGDGTNSNRNTPVNVTGLTSGATAISAGCGHTCALAASGGVKCWGGNIMGQLGDGTNTNRNTPVNVTGLTSGMAAIGLGSNHSCAVSTVGGAKCWGGNWAGQLGDGTNLTRNTPANVSGLTSGIAAIAGGSRHTCAVTTATGGVKCWGANGFGQVGDGTTTDRNTPVNVSDLMSGVATVAAGGDHTCAVITGGGLKCWGWDGWGQLGLGTITQRLTPADVVVP